MSVIFILLFYIVLLLWIGAFVIQFRKQITCMTGMMASMTMGMTLGLGVGTLIPGHLFDNMFHSSAAGMLIGGIAGALIGLPISIMAVLDGLLAGIMSGMMGPMLIGMIPEASANTAVKFILVLCACILFLVFIMLQQEIQPERLKQGPFLLHRQAPMFILVVSFLVLTVQFPLSKSPSPISADHAEHIGQVQHKQQPLVKVQAISVRATEFQLKNTGKMEHDFEIIGTFIHAHTKPGETKMVTFTIEKPGLYKAVCTLPGHLEAGMITPIRVS